MTAKDILRMAIRRACYYAETGQLKRLYMCRKVIRQAWSKRHCKDIVTFNRAALN